MISTHNTDAIQNYVSHYQPNIPLWLRLEGNIGKNDLDVKAKIFGADVGLKVGIKDFYCKLTSEARFTFAAWQWLDPINSLEDLDLIQVTSGLESVGRDIFLKKLQKQCKSITNQHPEISLWILKRLSLLDFLVKPPTQPPSELLQVESRLSLILGGLMRDIDRNPTIVRQQSRIILQQALETAGQLVCRVIAQNESECKYWVNLMLPMSPSALSTPLFRDSISQTNINLASNLWHGCPPSPIVLIVVAETTQYPEYQGFWVPAYPSAQNPTPGAATAYCLRKSSGVLKADLPPLLDTPQEVQLRWKDYMQTNFFQTAFISLPFWLDLGVNGKPVLAIVNININTPSNDGCWRVYHDEWLKFASKQVLPILREAFRAYMIVYEIDCGILGTRELPLLDPQLIRASQLAGFNSLILPSGTDHE